MGQQGAVQGTRRRDEDNTPVGEDALKEQEDKRSSSSQQMVLCGLGAMHGPQDSVASVFAVGVSYCRQ